MDAPHKPHGHCWILKRQLVEKMVCLPISGYECNPEHDKSTLGGKTSVCPSGMKSLPRLPDVAVVPWEDKPIPQRLTLTVLTCCTQQTRKLFTKIVTITTLVNILVSKFNQVNLKLIRVRFSPETLVSGENPTRRFSEIHIIG